MLAIISVKDKRTTTGRSTRSKEFATFNECLKWARHFKKPIQNEFLIIEDGEAKRYVLYTTRQFHEKYRL